LLFAAYEAEIHVRDGTYHGLWMARDRGCIHEYGCLSRTGSRLAGWLEDGSDMDVQVFEEEGKVAVIESGGPGWCDRRREGPTSSATKTTSGSILYCDYYCTLFAIPLAFIVGASSPA
jgi:hypothetical protein